MQFNLYPILENDTFEVFIKLNKTPTPDNADWIYVIPRNFTDSPTLDELSEKEMDELRHTIVLPSSNLTDGILYFGVRKIGSHYLFL